MRPIHEDPLAGHPLYERVRTIGRGQRSYVVVARSKMTGEQVAIRFIPRGWEPGHTKYVTREILNHQELSLSKHPHIVEFKEVFLTAQYLAEVLEYVEGETLQVFLEKVGGKVIEGLARFIFQQLIIALDFCHRKGKVNRDIKLSNILLSIAEGQLPLVKLCDFGVSKDTYRHSEPHSQVGTALFVAPEVMQNFSGGRYDGQAADVWACGVCLFIMLFGRHPYLRPEDAKLNEQQQMIKLFQRMMQNQIEFPPEQVASLTPECVDLLSRMLRTNPGQRATMGDIQRHPWFSTALPEGAGLMNDLFLAEESASLSPQSQSQIEALVTLAARREEMGPTVVQLPSRGRLMSPAVSSSMGAGGAVAGGALGGHGVSSMPGGGGSGGMGMGGHLPTRSSVPMQAGSPGVVGMSGAGPVMAVPPPVTTPTMSMQGMQGGQQMGLGQGPRPSLGTSPTLGMGGQIVSTVGAGIPQYPGGQYAVAGGGMQHHSTTITSGVQHHPQVSASPPGGFGYGHPSPAQQLAAAQQHHAAQQQAHAQAQAQAVQAAAAAAVAAAAAQGPSAMHGGMMQSGGGALYSGLAPLESGLSGGEMPSLGLGLDPSSPDLMIPDLDAMIMNMPETELLEAATIDLRPLPQAGSSTGGPTTSGGMQHSGGMGMRAGTPGAVQDTASGGMPGLLHPSQAHSMPPMLGGHAGGSSLVAPRAPGSVALPPGAHSHPSSAPSPPGHSYGSPQLLDSRGPAAAGGGLVDASPFLYEGNDEDLPMVGSVSAVMPKFDWGSFNAPLLANHDSLQASTHFQASRFTRACRDASAKMSESGLRSPTSNGGAQGVPGDGLHVPGLGDLQGTLAGATLM